MDKHSKNCINGKYDELIMKSTDSPLPVVATQCEQGAFVLCSTVNILYSYTTWFPCDEMYNIVNIKIKVFTFLKHKAKTFSKMDRLQNFNL